MKFVENVVVHPPVDPGTVDPETVDLSPEFIRRWSLPDLEHLKTMLALKDRLLGKACRAEAVLCLEWVEFCRAKGVDPAASIEWGAGFAPEDEDATEKTRWVLESWDDLLVRARALSVPQIASLFWAMREEYQREGRADTDARFAYAFARAVDDAVDFLIPAGGLGAHYDEIAWGVHALLAG